MGETIQGYIMNSLASSIKRFCSEPILKEAFVDMLGEKKLIRFTLDNTKWKETVYFKTAVVDGVLVLSSCEGQFPSNTDYAGRDFISTMSPPGQIVTLAMRKNIADNQKMLLDALEVLKNATGSDWDFEVDWPTIVPFYLKRYGRQFEHLTMTLHLIQKF